MASIGSKGWLLVIARVLERLVRQKESQEFDKMLTTLSKREIFFFFVKLQKHVFFFL